mmetsp:Transcript_76340/g.220612  ORF Transcript_76340/g.220612 Transcript_76340/m.220612 type:complete len:222 (-) Transcript_76340:284-949(-)
MVDVHSKGSVEAFAVETPLPLAMLRMRWHVGETAGVLREIHHRLHLPRLVRCGPRLLLLRSDSGREAADHLVQEGPHGFAEVFHPLVNATLLARLPLLQQLLNGLTRRGLHALTAASAIHDGYRRRLAQGVTIRQQHPQGRLRRTRRRLEVNAPLAWTQCLELVVVNRLERGCLGLASHRRCCGVHIHDRAAGFASAEGGKGTGGAGGACRCDSRLIRRAN